MKLPSGVLTLCLLLVVSTAYGQSGSLQDRQLKIIKPEEIEKLDPAFEMIMQKLDGDLRYILSAPVRVTPKGTALTGLTVLGTLFFLNSDENLLDHVTDDEGDRSNKTFGRLRVLGRHVPETTAGLYLLGYFLDDRPGCTGSGIIDNERLVLAGCANLRLLFCTDRRKHAKKTDAGEANSRQSCFYKTAFYITGRHV